MDNGYRPKMTEVLEGVTLPSDLSDREKVEAILGATVTGGDLAKPDTEVPNPPPEVEFSGNLEATTPLEIFGLPPTATAEEIKTAWRKLARMYHPDLHPEDPTVEEKFKIINNAYERLSGKNGRTSSSTETQTQARTETQAEQQSVSEKQFFENFGYDTSQFPKFPAEIAQSLEKISFDSPESIPENALEPLGEEIERNAVTVREIAGWLVLISLDVTFNHGYGTQNVLDQLLRDRALAPFMKWMGVDDDMMSYFINNTHDMAHALSHLDTPMLKQQLDHMSGLETYEFLASMTPSERQRFTSEGKLHGQYTDHVFDQNEKQRIVAKLSEAQRNRLQIPL